MKKVSELSTGIKSLRDLQALLPSLIYIMCIPVSLKYETTEKFKILILVPLFLCIFSSYIAWLISKSGKQNYAFRYSRSLNRLLLVVLILQITFRNSLPTHYYKELIYFIILLYLPLMIFLTCAAIMNLPFYAVLLIFLAEILIVYLNHDSITILATLFLLPIVDWLSEGLSEALKYGNIKEINYLLSLKKIHIVRFIADNPKFSKVLLGLLFLSWFIISEITDKIQHIKELPWNNGDNIDNIDIRLYSFLFVTLAYVIVVFILSRLFKRFVRSKG